MVGVREQQKAWTQKSIAHSGGPALSKEAAAPFLPPLKGGMGEGRHEAGGR